ncbi:hypothetical protein N752_19260 [Desulforamulus aquiferis]|nr:hypothetical protein N752_19260 [Desulforamulus aquiferis]
MKAITYQGVKDVRVKEVKDPKIEKPDDLIIKVTSTAICGSDLHLIHGLVPNMPKDYILGHETMGIVEEVGPEVRDLKKGDRVVVPFRWPVVIAGTVSMICTVPAITQIPMEK